MAHDDSHDPVWIAVLDRAEACAGEANDFHVIRPQTADPARPLYLLVHPGDTVQSDGDVAYSRNRDAIQDYSRQCQSGVDRDVERAIQAGWDVAVLHRFSSSYGFGVSGCLPEFTDAVDAIHEHGLVLFGDNLAQAAAYLVDTMQAARRPAVVLSGAWSETGHGCVAEIGCQLEALDVPVHLAASACISPDGSGREWRARRPRLSDADIVRLAIAKPGIAA
jgi:hypothetical protein